MQAEPSAQGTAEDAEPAAPARSRLYRVMWEIEVEADDEVSACYAARDAFASDTSRGVIHVAQYLDGEFSGYGPVIEVPNPFDGPHPGPPEYEPVSFDP
jgi:hypothetical protein